MEKNEIALELERFRESLGLSVRAMADLLGMPANSYAYYESKGFKREGVPPELAKKIANNVLPRVEHQVQRFPLIWAAIQAAILKPSGSGGGSAFVSHGIEQMEDGSERIIPPEPGDAHFNKVVTVHQRVASPKQPLPDWMGEEAERSPPAIIGDLVSVGGIEQAAVGRYDARLSAGPGSLINGEEPDGFILFEAQWLRAITRSAPNWLAVLSVDGDSMERTLSDRDMVLVDRSQNRLGREGIYAIRVGDFCWVKRLSINLRDRVIRIISDNTQYPMQELPEDEVDIIGRVVSIVGRRL